MNPDDEYTIQEDDGDDVHFAMMYCEDDKSGSVHGTCRVWLTPPFLQMFGVRGISEKITERICSEYGDKSRRIAMLMTICSHPAAECDKFEKSILSGNPKANIKKHKEAIE